MMRCLAFLMLLLVSACSAGAATGEPQTPSVFPTQPRRPSPTPRPPDTGWRTVSDGIDTRELDVVQAGRRDRLVIARVDPGRAAFRVLYDPELPRRVAQWIDAAGARLVINGGFFDRNHRALGLLIADGEAFGQTYVDLGGLLGVRAGQVQVRSLIHRPYRTDEFFDHMVQSFPTLLIDGAPNGLIRDDGRIAPRSVAGVDRRGRVVLLVSPLATFSLTDLARWLAQSDLDLDAALNLDGGTSAGLMVRTADGVWGANSWVPVPAVIAVE